MKVLRAGLSPLTERSENFERYGFDERASSAVVSSERWEVCDDIRFRGRCVVLRPGRTRRCRDGLEQRHFIGAGREQNARIADIVTRPFQCPRNRFLRTRRLSRSVFHYEKQINNFSALASMTALVGRGSGDLWEVCEDDRFSGRCVVLRQADIRRWPDGLERAAFLGADQSTGTRASNDGSLAPPPAPVYDGPSAWKRASLPGDVTSVRAVLGTPGQRCWVEREQVRSGSKQRQRSSRIAGRHHRPAFSVIRLGAEPVRYRHCRWAVAGAMVGSNIGRQRPAGADPRRPALRKRTQPGPTRLLGCHLHFRVWTSIQMTRPPGNTCYRQRAR